MSHDTFRVLVGTILGFSVGVSLPFAAAGSKLAQAGLVGWSVAAAVWLYIGLDTRTRL